MSKRKEMTISALISEESPDHTPQSDISSQLQPTIKPGSPKPEVILILDEDEEKKPQPIALAPQPTPSLSPGGPSSLFAPELKTKTPISILNPVEPDKKKKRPTDETTDAPKKPKGGRPSKIAHILATLPAETPVPPKVEVPKPSFVNVTEEKKADEPGSLLASLMSPGRNVAAKPTAEETKEPIIILDVPLNAPGQAPGTAEVVFNVMKLAEEQYGWKNVHPNAKFAMDILDDLDSESEGDNDSDMEEDQTDIAEAPKSPRSLASLAASEKQRKAIASNNRKVGKYDKLDPFIDDSEMFWEEQAASTKDGFFVYWGPLVDEGQHTRIERADGTVKRGRGGKRPGPAPKSKVSK
ncbi:hypothetical protein BABINDRAFT_163155 [Babjeviella inositovora NRRL Y-12698]|uniref:Hpc2-related domain-containing protein n=1 Tax=Babjeviella inositovora NRRL Y-12698 TaxID=984486 RepID=A0A1E3QJ73_9ASCO|nr:uncharacterized protein BABINDRAFT_163155 [Babjeviella inositovora NRRL Y-12698]ODQ77756.1 hypothetical protein BABINDRAFT_163155 [Babjeviella inositovora NRRL Y-12698]